MKDETNLEELLAALGPVQEPEMTQEEYIEALEEHIQELITANQYGREAMQTFIDILTFIGTNFGETADYPVRIDSDFYKDVFLKELNQCQEKVEIFLEKYDRLQETVDLEEDEIF